MPSRQAGFLCAALLALVPLAVLPGWALAQAPPPSSSVPSEGAPPAVVGWLAQSSGTVWIAPGTGQAWQAPVTNEPLSEGEAIATAPNGQALIEVAATRLELGPGSELGLDKIDTQDLDISAISGEVALDLSALPPGMDVAIRTPRGTVQIAAPGQYAITAGDENAPTIVTALSGTARIVTASAMETVAAGQGATLSGEPGGSFTIAIGPARPDPLLQTLLASAPPPPPEDTSLPPDVAEMTGGAALASYGAWSVVPDYGTIWFPSVAAGWAPYRYGQWIYMSPWGWTWCDSAPWGFAPFHYGRWVQIGPRWGWVPIGPGVPPHRGFPVYAPALVHFFSAGKTIGWVPLGPGELYRPSFARSPEAIRALNAYDVRNPAAPGFARGAVGHLAISDFRNHGAATYVPRSVLSEGHPVAPAFSHAPREDLAAFKPLPGGMPLRRPMTAPPALFSHPSQPPLAHTPITHMPDIQARPLPPLPSFTPHAPVRLPAPPRTAPVSIHPQAVRPPPAPVGRPMPAQPRPATPARVYAPHRPPEPAHMAPRGMPAVEHRPAPPPGRPERPARQG
jgi:hypothetical protein